MKNHLPIKIPIRLFYWDSSFLFLIPFPYDYIDQQKKIFGMFPKPNWLILSKEKRIWQWKFFISYRSEDT